MNSQAASESPRGWGQSRISAGTAAAWAGISGVAVLLGARLTEILSIPWPPCGLRTLTGIPCPLCGTTRSLIAWSHLEAGEAFALNPLASIALIGGAIWVALQLTRAVWGVPMSPALGQVPRWRRWPVVLIGLVLANWVYLLFNLPR